jgi:gamma-glutamyl hercynylcysteine S-oxide hydrolase
MCRHLGWFGAPRTLSALVLEPEHGLLRQSWQPRHQQHGTVNADGWGVGFHPDPQPGRPDMPVRWRSDRPLWSDTSFAAVAPHLSSSRVVAAVRSATAGMPADASAAAPFLHDGWLVSHNGVVDRAAVGPRLDAESSCDSALLAAHVVGQGVDRLDHTLGSLAAADPGARLNLLLLGRDRLIAVAWGDTLYLRSDPDGVLLASEPDETSGWRPVPDRHVVEVGGWGSTIRAVEEA